MILCRFKHTSTTSSLDFSLPTSKVHCGGGHVVEVDASALREECPICLEPTHLQGLQCETCHTWFHPRCVMDYLTSDHTRSHSCPMCTVPWGEEGEDARASGSSSRRSKRTRGRRGASSWCMCASRICKILMGSASCITFVLVVVLLL